MNISATPGSLSRPSILPPALRRRASDRLASSVMLPHIEVQDMPTADDSRSELAQGLLAATATINPKFFYDEQGCALFGAICQLPEYYLTRSEAAIFTRYRKAMLQQMPPRAQWVDLGCGDCQKSRPWLAEINAERFIGVDIAEPWLLQALMALSRQQPQLECIGVVTDFTRPLELESVLSVSSAAPVFFYPGSSIGNFEPAQALELLSAIRRHLDGQPDGCLVIGVDLIKSVDTLEAAYDDALGITAAFNRNVLRVSNRLLGTDFDLQQFSHCAFFDAEHSRVEMHLQARSAQRVFVNGVARDFARGDCILTEYSYKYSPQTFQELLNAAGFDSVSCWTDDWTGREPDFAVFVAHAGR